ncbi:MAG: GNAT family N-acetyltransferase [Bacteroidales bacterium]|nr:GNAT family N-acetyltransferase [Bacteroidales bacterium]
MMKEKAKRPDSYYGYMEGWISLIVNAALFAIKFWAGVVSGSVALIADAWHTLSDSLTSIVVLVGFKISGKPADRQHPFGHGRAELIGAIIIGLILAMVGFNFLLESISKLNNHQSGNFGTIAIVVTIISVVIKEALAQMAIRFGKKISSRSLIADGWHHRSDAISSAIILVGIIFSGDFWWIDAVLGLLVSAIIFYTAYELLKDAINPLLGEKPDDELLVRIREIADEVCNRELHIHHIHVHNYGNHSEMTFHIQLPGNTSLVEAHETATRLEKTIKQYLNIETTIHMEPMNIRNMTVRSYGFMKHENSDYYNKCLEIRKKVFVKEQNVDLVLEIENEEECRHYLITLDNIPAATGRWRETENGYKLERFAVLDKYRMTGLGRVLMEAILTDILPTQKPVYLNAQTNVVGFYEKYGFVKTGEPFVEAGIEHYKMLLDL